MIHARTRQLFAFALMALLLAGSSSAQPAGGAIAWRPWSAAAFKEAIERDLPVYAWVEMPASSACARLAEECFSDASIVDLLTTSFIPVRVDALVRSDVEAFCRQAMTIMRPPGGVAWPFSVWLTPSGEPFAGGSALTARGEDERTGLATLLERVATAWQEQRAKLEASAAGLLRSLQRAGVAQNGKANPARLNILRALVEQAQHAYDAEAPGFGAAPRFAQTSLMRSLLMLEQRLGSQRASSMVVTTLKAMSRGAFRDQLGGGFMHIAHDRNWRQPGGEMLLCDQAEMARTTLEAWQLTGDAELGAVAREVCSSLVRDWRTADGAFIAALSGDSCGEVNRAWTWTEEELASVLAKDELEVFLRSYELDSWLSRSDRQNDPASEAIVAACREKLLAHRAATWPPGRVDTVVAGWNGLAIAALAEAGAAFGDDTLISAAVQAATALRRDCFGESGALRRIAGTDPASSPACLDDLAFVAEGLSRLWQVTGDVKWLELARRLCQTAIQEFAIPADEGGGLMLARAVPGEPLVPTRVLGLPGLPSPTAALAMTLMDLARVDADDRLRARSLTILQDLGLDLESAPVLLPDGVRAADRVQHEAPHVRIAGVAGDARQALAHEYWRRYLPGGILEPVARDEGAARAWVMQDEGWGESFGDPTSLGGAIDRAIRKAALGSR